MKESALKLLFLSRRVLTAVIALGCLLLSTSISHAYVTYSRADFDTLIARQDTVLQNALRSMLPDSSGFFITGPLDPFASDDPEVAMLYQTVRVVCPDLRSLQKAIRAIKDRKDFKILSLRHDIDKARRDTPAGYRGVVIRFRWADSERSVQVLTQHQLRWLIWAGKVGLLARSNTNSKRWRDYAIAVSDYLREIDLGKYQANPPQASGFELDKDLNIYANPTNEATQGSARYDKFANEHPELRTEFAKGIVAFVPTDSTLRVFSSRAPAEAYGDENESSFQDECREFYERGGDARSIRTLDSSSFNMLSAGQYCFAVGLNGSIRFTPDFLPDGTARNEKETDRRVPQASCSLLFPGEPILTAGEFSIERDSVVRIAKVNARSELYFHIIGSQPSKSDAAAISDHYFASLGHFFNALDRMGIKCPSVLISKF